MGLDLLFDLDGACARKTGMGEVAAARGLAPLHPPAPAPNVAGGLTRLKDESHRFWVATSKPEIFARRILLKGQSRSIV